jgi:rubrerythrin
MQNASTNVSLKNRTGMQRSPVQSQELLQSTADHQDPALPNPEADGLAEVRAEYIEGAEPLGTIPAPLTATGVVESAANMLTGRRLHVFMDKLAERLAFERGGTRLYDALLAKHLAAPEADGDGAVTVTRDTLIEMRNEESEHFLLVSDCITELGGDPTAATPCADVAGVQSMGLVQTVTDPRTSLVQSLSAILAAELVDNAAWELLVQLAQGMGQDDMAAQFERARLTEARHLKVIRGWYTSLTLAESGRGDRSS